jgi:hypothetical protein
VLQDGADPGVQSALLFHAGLTDRGGKKEDKWDSVKAKMLDSQKFVC